MYNETKFYSTCDYIERHNKESYLTSGGDDWLSIFCFFGGLLVMLVLANLLQLAMV